MIRKLDINDIDTIIKLELEVFNESLGYDMLFKEITSNKLARYFVLEQNNKVVGYVGGIICEGIGEIYNFLIDRFYQSKGYGKLLLKHFLNILKEENGVSCSLEVKETNAVAINLYESLGFKIEYIRKNYYKDNTNALLLVKWM